LDVLGLGLDLSLSPQWTISLDANQLWFDKTAVLEALLHQPDISRRLGAEVVWTPYGGPSLRKTSSCVCLRRSWRGGPGYRAIYGGSNPFSVFALLSLTY